MYHYTYKLEHLETGEFYFGSRSSKIHPSIDSYLGSMRNWRPDKSKLIKTIIRYDFQNREDCILSERELILEHRKDSLNRNRHIPGVGFNTVGLGQYCDENGKVYRINKDDELVKNGTLKPFWKGKKHTEISKIKMRNSARHRNISPENEILRRKSISNTLKGRERTKEYCEKLSISKQGEKNPMFGKKAKRVDCPQCGKNISINNANRFHFSNCKFGK